MPTARIYLPDGDYTDSINVGTGTVDTLVAGSIANVDPVAGGTLTVSGSNEVASEATYLWQIDNSGTWESASGTNNGATYATSVAGTYRRGVSLPAQAMVYTDGVVVGESQVPTGISVVATGGGVVPAGTGTTNITIPGTPVEGDLVVVWAVKDNNFTSAIGLVSGYTSHFSNTNFGGSTARLMSKFMGSTPDTVIPMAQIDGNAGEVQAVLVALVRGVDETTRLDVALPSAANSSGSTITPPAITTATDGALVGIFGLFDDRPGATVNSAPSGYSDLAAQSTGGLDGSGCIGLFGFIEVATAGTETPGSWVMSTSDQWGAITIALRPA